jgi:hypothetical protein
MDTTDTVEPEEMSGRVLGIIGAYGLGAALDPRRRRRTARADPHDAGLADDAGEHEAEVTEEPRARKSA